MTARTWSATLSRCRPPPAAWPEACTAMHCHMSPTPPAGAIPLGALLPSSLDISHRHGLHIMDCGMHVHLHALACRFAQNRKGIEAGVWTSYLLFETPGNSQLLCCTTQTPNLVTS